MSKFERINTFIKVIEENSFTAAARTLQISPAAVSKQITALEKALGVQLLKRNTRRLHLTAIGEQYYLTCKQALNQVLETETLITWGQKEPSGTLRITANRYFAENYLLPRLAGFLAHYPKITLHLELAERFPDLAQEGIDILFGVSLLGSTDLVCRKVMSTRYVLCASPSYLTQYGKPQIPADLKQHRYITHSMRQPANTLTFPQQQTIQVEPILWLNDANAMLQCALKGLGIVKLHEYMVKEALATGELIELLPQFNEPDLPVYLYYQPSRHLQPKIRCFIDFYFKVQY
ncbi:MAG: dmlR [Gammaproteobacteria bacterium]|jgi:DNA-binding transcriptional LysR family regulator|nr:dmlR [Gammaproteobacteria bacterium]